MYKLTKIKTLLSYILTPFYDWISSKAHRFSCVGKQNVKIDCSRQIGVEPMTFRLGNGRSIHWATGAWMLYCMSKIII